MIGLGFGNFQSGGGGFDPDAQAFITAAGITGETQQAAINQLVLDLKGTGSTTNNSDLWTSKIHAFYPTCPIDDSTATLIACSFNLRDVSRHQITWNNSPTVSVSGVTGNGFNQYGDTGYNILTNGTLNNSHFSSYKDISWDNTSNFWGTRVGGLVFETTFDPPSKAFSTMYNTSTGRLIASISNGTGVKYRITISRTSSSSNVIYENGASVGSNATSGGTLPNATAWLLGSNGLGGYDDSTVQCASLGLGLTANEAKDLDDAIQTFNTTLGR